MSDIDNLLSESDKMFLELQNHEESSFENNLLIIYSSKFLR